MLYFLFVEVLSDFLILLSSFLNIFIIISLNSLANYLSPFNQCSFLFCLFFCFVFLVSPFGAYYSLSSFCLTFCACSYELDEIAFSPNLEKVVLYRSGLCSRLYCQASWSKGSVHSDWGAACPKGARSRWGSLVYIHVLQLHVLWLPMARQVLFVYRAAWFVYTFIPCWSRSGSPLGVCYSTLLVLLLICVELPGV